MFSPRRRVTVVEMLAAACVALLLTAPPAAAGPREADDVDGTVTWSVRPADASGEDGRAWVEQELDPGETATEHLALRNLSDQDVTFRITAADGYFGENGRFSMLPSDQESVDAGLWIDVTDEVTVRADETAILPFTTVVPENASPGDHAAGIAASILSRQAMDGGGTVGVESRVGFRVMTRVAGDVDPGVTVDGVFASYRASGNPFAPGAAAVRFDVVNIGNTRVVVTGAVEAAGRVIEFPADAEPDQELLPGDRRTVVVPVDDLWPTVFVPAHLHVTPRVLEGSGSEMAPLSVSLGVWAWPWSQLAVLAGLALIVGSGLWGRVRSKRRLTRMLALAREEGRREARRRDGA
ncbi:hypothetical protein [Isoptericola croceus]|uniref:hypothetical protein n=1 Tax=Isoptericola croceus TaxID=3031406 RepID=UPI0023F71C4C|nr:hypothetical protein [Isoptericola croceus]